VLRSLSYRSFGDLSGLAIDRTNTELSCNIPQMIHPNPCTMKATLFSRTILLVSALIFSIATCKGQDDSSGQVVGTWIKSFDEVSIAFSILPDQTFEVEFTGDDEPEVTGSYRISGTRITFTDEGGERSSGTSGTYTFKAGEGTLTFTIVDDPAEGRSMLLQGTWSKAGD
jgi:hypothetical protein